MFWPQVWVTCPPPPQCNKWYHNPQHVQGSLVELHKGPLKTWQRLRSCSTFCGLIPLIPPIRFKCQSGLSRYTEVASYSCPLSHSNLHSVHLPVFPATVLRFFIDELPSCLSKHLFSKRLSQALGLQLWEIPSLFLEGFWHGRNLLPLLSCTLHGSSWKRDLLFLNILCPYYASLQSYINLGILFPSKCESTNSFLKF